MRDAVVKNDNMRDAIVKDLMRDAIVNNDNMRDAIVKDLMRDAIVKNDMSHHEAHEWSGAEDSSYHHIDRSEACVEYGTCHHGHHYDLMRDAIVKDLMRDAVVKNDNMRDAIVKDDNMRDAVVKN